MSGIGAFLLDVSGVLGGLGIVTAFGVWLVNRRKPEVDRGMLHVAETTSTLTQQSAFLTLVLTRLKDVEARIGELETLHGEDRALIRDLLADIDDLEAHIWEQKPPPPPRRRRAPQA